MKYFKMSEFECRDGCPMPASARENIEALVEEVLDPLRESYGKPIVVNSGYRCPKHNREVGGVGMSQHLRGEAADISVRRSDYASDDEWGAANQWLAALIREKGDFDQLILYQRKNGVGLRFVHVSWKRTGANRRKVMYKE